MKSLQNVETEGFVQNHCSTWANFCRVNDAVSMAKSMLKQGQGSRIGMNDNGAYVLKPYRQAKIILEGSLPMECVYPITVVDFAKLIMTQRYNDNAMTGNFWEYDGQFVKELTRDEDNRRTQIQYRREDYIG